MNDLQSDMDRILRERGAKGLSPGGKLQSMRRKIAHVCPVCSETFQGTVRAKFCSNRCKQADKYRRSKLG